MAEQTDIIILGAGAAGLMCAITAARRGRRVMVLDHAREAGAKILISGGGRCNFTNLHTAPERFHSVNPHFCRSALSYYKPADFIALVDRHRIAWHEKTLGQLFCDGSARAIVSMLLAECAAAGATIRLQQRVGAVTRADRFSVETDKGAIEAGSLVLATGGLSIPKLGATGLAHDVATRFGLRLTQLRPALVPLISPPGVLGSDGGLAGVSMRVVARCGRAAFEEGMVFTHRGLSGPAILQVSSLWREGEAIGVDFLPTLPPGSLAARKKSRPKAGLRAILGELLPQRLADAFLPDSVGQGPIAEIPDRILAALEDHMRGWRVQPAGSEGYAKAEVTLGGVDTRDLVQNSLAARLVPGLFVIGEAVDVTGWLGGYNFQWAWASGACAGAVA